MKKRSICQLRLGFVGYGVHARANLYPSIELAGARLTRIATRSMHSARAAAARTGADYAHDSVASMLSHRDLDAVFISVSPEDQARITEQCLHAKLHVFVEKPLGMNAQEATRISDLARDRQRLVMTGFMKRHAPAYQQLARLIADRQRFGQLIAIDGTFGITPWTNELRDESFLKFAAIHVIDLYRWLLGEVTAVRGFSSSREADLASSYVFEFEQAAVGSLALYAVPAWSREHERICVTGTHGWAEVRDISTLRYHHASSTGNWRTLDQHTIEVTAANSPMSGGSRDLIQRGFAGEIDHFLQAVANHGTVNPCARDNIATMQLCQDMLTAINDSTSQMPVT